MRVPIFLETMLPKIRTHARYQCMSNKVINNQIRVSQFVFTPYFLRASRILIRLLRLSRMTR